MSTIVLRTLRCPLLYKLKYYSPHYTPTQPFLREYWVGCEWVLAFIDEFACWLGCSCSVPHSELGVWGRRERRAGQMMETKLNSHRPQSFFQTLHLHPIHGACGVGGKVTTRVHCSDRMPSRLRCRRWPLGLLQSVSNIKLDHHQVIHCN